MKKQRTTKNYVVRKNCGNGKKKSNKNVKLLENEFFCENSSDTSMYQVGKFAFDAV